MSSALSDEQLRDLFGDFETLYDIEVLGVRFQVPEDNNLLRAFQYIQLTQGGIEVDWQRFCWNNRNNCCDVVISSGPGQAQRRIRACRVQVKEGMQVHVLPAPIKLQQ